MPRQLCPVLIALAHLTDPRNSAVPWRWKSLAVHTQVPSECNMNLSRTIPWRQEPGTLATNPTSLFSALGPLHELFPLPPVLFLQMVTGLLIFPHPSLSSNGSFSDSP